MKDFKTILNENLLATQPVLSEGLVDNAKLAASKIGRTLTKQRFLTGFSTKSSSDHLDAAADELTQTHPFSNVGENNKLANVVVRHPSATSEHLNAAIANGALNHVGVKAYLDHPNTSTSDVHDRYSLFSSNAFGSNDREQNLKDIVMHPKTSIHQKVSALNVANTVSIPSNTFNKLAGHVVSHLDTDTRQLGEIANMSNDDKTLSKIAEHPKVNSNIISSLANKYGYSEQNTALGKSLFDNHKDNIDVSRVLASKSNDKNVLDHYSNTESPATVNLARNVNANSTHLHAAINSHLNDKESGWRFADNNDHILSHPKLDDSHKIKMAKSNIAASELLSDEKTSPAVLRAIYNNHETMREKAQNHTNGIALRNFGLPQQ